MNTVYELHTNKKCKIGDPIVTAPRMDKLSAVVDVYDTKLRDLAYSTALAWIENHELGVVRVTGSAR